LGLEFSKFFFHPPDALKFKIFGNRLSVFPILFLPLQSNFSKTMYAIVDIAGKQFKVAKDQYIYAPKLDGEQGAAVSFDKVLLIDDGSTVNIGAPTVNGAKVSGKILEHVKGNKVIVFMKKRRKGYAVKNGHRQQYTKVQI
jgi:large subunit ribosomal protein L21